MCYYIIPIHLYLLASCKSSIFVSKPSSALGKTLFLLIMFLSTINCLSCTINCVHSLRAAWSVRMMNRRPNKWWRKIFLNYTTASNSSFFTHQKNLSLQYFQDCIGDQVFDAFLNFRQNRPKSTLRCVRVRHKCVRVNRHGLERSWRQEVLQSFEGNPTFFSPLGDFSSDSALSGAAIFPKPLTNRR